MITVNHSRYHINENQFDNLFTENVNIKTLDALGKSAKDGNLDCIDMLYNLALRHDDVGKKAENILFDLFSGKTKGKTAIDEEIQLAGLKLYETACNDKGKNNEDMRKFYYPSKLLYITGSAITNITEKQNLSAIFREGESAQSQFEQFDNLDVWNNARMLMTDEINASMKKIIQNTDNFSLNFPIGLIEPVKKSNMLSEQISEKINSNKSLNKPYKFDKIELFPINTGEHWVLFVLYNDKHDHNTKCVIFNSLGELNENTKIDLIESAKAAKVSEKNIEFINGNMQKYVPNGCGIFVIKAMERLSHAPQKTPVDNLKEFTDGFAKLSAEEQTLFNIQTRRQLYEHSIP